MLSLPVQVSFAIAHSHRHGVLRENDIMFLMVGTPGKAAYGQQCHGPEQDHGIYLVSGCEELWSCYLVSLRRYNVPHAAYILPGDIPRRLIFFVIV